jgi:phosphoribosylanthranilate isomerase
VSWVKLCGMTRRSDVEAAVAAGADAVGFVTHPGSPRCVTLEDVAGLVDGLGLATFLVTVDAEAARLVESALDLGVTGVQPHGRGAFEAATEALAGGLRVLFPVHPSTGGSMVDVPNGAIPLLDNSAEGLHGGTGLAFDWSLAAEVPERFVLAGGLDPGNVAEAIRRTGAWGVDVASGIEASPGVKDHAMLRRFVEEAR